MFANTLALIDECDIVHAHIFPYSPREGTPAARMPQVEIEVRKARAAKLRDCRAPRVAPHVVARTLIGTEQDVLVERPGDRGHAGNFADVHQLPHFRSPWSLSAVLHCPMKRVIDQQADTPTEVALTVRHRVTRA